MKYWMAVCGTFLAFGCAGSRTRSGDAADGDKGDVALTETGHEAIADRSPDGSISDGGACWEAAVGLADWREADVPPAGACPDQTPQTGAPCNDVGLCCSYPGGPIQANPSCSAGEGGWVCACKQTNTCGVTWECILGV